jgi:hypothetical protein
MSIAHYTQRQDKRISRTSMMTRCLLRCALLLLLPLALSACTVLVPDAQELPDTWLPLPTVAPYATDTPGPPPTSDSTPLGITPTAMLAQPTSTSTPLAQAPTVTPTPISPDAAITPEAVDGLLGFLRSLPDTARFDDYFTELRQDVQWGIAPANEAMESVLAEARDSDRAVRVWGWVERDVDDYGGVRIVVERLEFASPPPSPAADKTPTVAPTPTPDTLPSPTVVPETPSPTITPDILPSPTAIPEALPSPSITLEAPRPVATPPPPTEMVEGWPGTIHSLPSGSAYDDYFFALDREKQYGIASTLSPVEEQLRGYRDSGIVIRIWGILEHGVDDHGGMRIYVIRIEEVD